MSKVTIHQIIKTSIITAFTLATALIWRDVIVEFIELFFPGEELLYKFLVALLSTILIVIILYLILEAEKETKTVWKFWKRK